MPQNEIEILPAGTHGYSTEDLVELGTQLTSQGFVGGEARALINLTRQLAEQAALQMAPAVLEQVRKINEARMLQVISQIRMLPSQLGRVSRDQVLAIVQRALSTPPPRV